MYTMKILEREPALSHFLSAHLPPQWGAGPVLCPGGAGRSGGGLPRPYPGPIRSHRLPGPAGARFPGPSGGRTLRGLGGELRPDPPGHPHLLQPGAGYPLPGSAAGTGHPVRGLPGTPGMAPAPAKSSLSPLPSGLRGPSAAAGGPAGGGPAGPGIGGVSFHIRKKRHPSGCPFFAKKNR